MSSSGPDDDRRNGIRHKPANTSPITMTRRGNFGVAKSSRMARRYAMPATPSGTMKDSAPTLLKLREQIVSATSKMAPSPYNLPAGVSFTGLPCLPQLCHRRRPQFQPDRRSWRPSGREFQFRGEPGQVDSHVDVVEGIGEADGELECAST